MFLKNQKNRKPKCTAYIGRAYSQYQNIQFHCKLIHKYIKTNQKYTKNTHIKIYLQLVLSMFHHYTESLEWFHSLKIQRILHLLLFRLVLILLSLDALVQVSQNLQYIRKYLIIFCMWAAGRGGGSNYRLETDPRNPLYLKHC